MSELNAAISEKYTFVGHRGHATRSVFFELVLGSNPEILKCSRWSLVKELSSCALFWGHKDLYASTYPGTATWTSLDPVRPRQNFRPPMRPESFRRESRAQLYLARLPTRFFPSDYRITHRQGIRSRHPSLAISSLSTFPARSSLKVTPRPPTRHLTHFPSSQKRKRK